MLIGDVDTGADFAHPDLQGKLVAGARFTDGTGSPSGGGEQDDVGHGTMTTGIMVADTNNGIGIAAVAPGARALIVKVLDSSGRGYSNDVAAGIDWAAAHGARVINLSLGPEIPLVNVAGLGDPIQTAIENAYRKGVAVALAAGNNGLPVSQYLQSAALIVGAVGPDGSVAGYSNGADIYAPGGTGSGDAHTQVISTHVDPATGAHDYKYDSGTSFATPQVAGVLAQLMARGYSNSAAYSRIRATAVTRAGVPELDAARALGASGTCNAAPPVHPAGHASGGAPAVPSSVPHPSGVPRASTSASTSQSASATASGAAASGTLASPGNSPPPVLPISATIAGIAALAGGAAAIRGRRVVRQR